CMELLDPRIRHGAVQGISGRHATDEDQHDEAHALLPVIRAMGEGHAGASQDHDGANPQWRRRGAFGLLIERGIVHEIFQGKKFKSAAAMKPMMGESIADIGCLAPIDARSAVPAAHQRVSDADADNELQNCDISCMQRRRLPCPPRADNIGAQALSAGASMIIWLSILGGRYGGRAVGALRRLFIMWAATSSVLAGLTGLGHATTSPCVSRAFEGASYIVCTFDLREYALRLFWKDENGVPYGGFDHLPRRIGAAPIVFAMNAGMYD